MTAAPARECQPDNASAGLGIEAEVAVLDALTFAENEECKQRPLMSQITNVLGLLNLERAKALEWQPIATAPKDGTPMLLCYWEGSADVLPVTSGFWSRLGEEWFSEISGRRCKPTHWMPLPTYSLPLERSGGAT